MPVYVYEVILPDGSGGETFEVLQSMSESPLTVHPETGQSVRRAVTAPNVTGKWSEAGMNANLSDKQLAAKGFTKYIKTGEGNYEKTAGDGPKSISADRVRSE
jgi:predicted nucleic acid-binding Zn ribbon protein